MESNVQVLGISIDHIPALQAWANSLEGISFPLLSDFWPHGEVSKKYGVLRSEGYSERAIFIIDKKGVIQYIDIHDIDDQPSNKVLFKELERIDPHARFSITQTSDQDDPALPKDGMVMYCNNWCPDCRRARKWFKENKIAYVEVDVNTNPKAAEQVRKWADGNLITPTFDIDGKIIVDFDKEKLLETIRGKI